MKKEFRMQESEDRMKNKRSFFPVIPNRQSLAQSFCNDMKFSPDLGYKNDQYGVVVTSAPGRAKIRSMKARNRSILKNLTSPVLHI